MAAESPKLSLPWRLFLLGLGVLAVLPYALGVGDASLSVLVVAAIPLYLAAHAVRVLRLIVLLGNESPSLRAVMGAHCISAAAGFLPAKTGEGARILAEHGTRWVTGGGAEVLTESFRLRHSPLKYSAAEYYEAQRAILDAGMGSTATMVIGFDESLDERLEH